LLVIDFPIKKSFPQRNHEIQQNCHYSQTSSIKRRAGTQKIRASIIICVGRSI
jgi:hypothetical protein